MTVNLGNLFQWRGTLLLTMFAALMACGAADDDAAIDGEEPAAANEFKQVDASPYLRVPAAGPVIGFEAEHGALAWLGVPFAQPPVGELRWRAPRSIESWDAPRAAQAFASPCVQLPVDMPGSGIDPDAPYGSEDCLYLNVYTPPLAASLAKEAKLPVMLWIHGGGNTIGEASQFDGSLLAAEQNVVVVTINYRLGPFGWFRHPDITGTGESDADRSGNFGILDQIEALRWTRDNIEAFGGDADNVTIFGESAGGRNVVALLFSPLADGLYHRAIAQSGASYFTSKLAADSLHPYAGKAVVKDIMAAQSSTDTAALRQLDAHKLLHYFAVTNDSGLPLLDLPNVFRDGYVIAEEAGLQGFINGDFSEVPIMLGTNRDEEKLFMFLDPKYISKWLGFWQRPRDAKAYERDAYYLSHRWRIAGAEGPARAMDRPVYIYRFDWDEQATPLGMDFPAMIGAAHGLEMAFVFGELEMGLFDKVLLTDDNRQAREALSREMMKYWGNFARTGNPNAGKTVPVKWLPWSDQEQFIIFDTPADDGIRMSRDTTTYRQLMNELTADTRFDNDEQRCELLLELIYRSPELASWKKAVGC